MGSGKVNTWLAKVDTFRPRVDTFRPGVDTFGGRLNTCPPLRPMRPGRSGSGLRFVRRRLRPRGCRWGMIRRIWPDLQQTLELGVVETVPGRDSGKLVQPRARPQSAEGGVD